MGKKSADSYTLQSPLAGRRRGQCLTLLTAHSAHYDETQLPVEEVSRPGTYFPFSGVSFSGSGGCDVFKDYHFCRIAVLRQQF
jgi:hypothetical protein